ncbi:MAG TPA: SURF1 family protein [Nevskiaceae bacterium]
MITGHDHPDASRAASLFALRMHERRHFRPRWWSCLIALLGCSALCGLGVWQIQRGLQKATYLEQHKLAQATPAKSLAALDDRALPPEARAIRVWADGHYDAHRQLLMDGQSHGEQTGYDVLTPFILADGHVVMVNRGWVPRAVDSQPPDTSRLAVGRRPRRIEGLWRSLPRPALRLAGDGCAAQAWPRHVLYPTDGDLRCLYGERIRHGVVELDARLPDGYVRDWADPVGFPPVRHYGYAAQWFMFSLIGLFLFYRLNLRRTASLESSPCSARAVAPKAGKRP